MLAKRLNIPIAQVLGSATFYTQFRFEPVGKYVIRLCHATACHIAGAEKINDTLRANLGIQENQTTENGLFTLERVVCLGCCSLAPVVMINEQVYGSLTPDRIVRIIDEYIGRGGYRALAKALTAMTPDDIIKEIKESGLRGRGGVGAFVCGEETSLIQTDVIAQDNP